MSTTIGSSVLYFSWNNVPTFYHFAAQMLNAYHNYNRNFIYFYTYTFCAYGKQIACQHYFTQINSTTKHKYKMCMVATILCLLIRIEIKQLYSYKLFKSSLPNSIISNNSFTNSSSSMSRNQSTQCAKFISTKSVCYICCWIERTH